MKSREESMMGRGVLLAIGPVCAVLMTVAVAGCRERQKEPIPRDELARIASETCPSCPKMMSDQLEHSSVAASDRTLVFTYRFVNAEKGEVRVTELVPMARKMMLEAVCGNREERKRLLERGVTVRWAYVDKNQDLVTALEVALKDCAG